MPTISLTNVGTDNVNTASATPINNNNAIIQAAVNALDNQNIAGAAAIAYAKLNLAGAILNADISPSAAIAISKLANYPTDATKALFGDGTWKAVSSGTPPGTELDYVQTTSDVTVAAGTKNTEATAQVILTGASITYDGTKNVIEFSFPEWTNTNDFAGQIMQAVFKVDSTVIGQARLAGNAVAPGLTYRTLHTPSAGAHVYSVLVFCPGGTGGTGTVKAGAGGTGNLQPTYLRVMKA